MSTTTALPEGVRRIESIEDSGPLVVLNHEVDLDQLMLDLAAEGDWDPYSGRTWEDYRDEPTTIWGASYHAPEAMVGWFRNVPAVRGNCLCGNGHAFDLFPASTDEKPEGNKARGAFLGVWFV
ncbi:hypothetical protein ACFPJ1_40500 [Kribbella qitaiheensis]|uniref:hypothetical protein n=1 Tax=Kribbella qitaiheensis TaxID=1544730 RepID=UPI00361248D1